MKRHPIQSFFAVIVVGLFLTVSGCGDSVTVKDVAPEEPAETYPNAQLLVSTDKLADMLGDDHLAVIDARSDGYDESHIPGAIHMPHPRIARASLNLESVSFLEDLMTRTGLARDMKIVVYDDTTASWGAAGRIFWALEFLGFTDVHLLNGGWDKWTAEERRTETTPSTLPALEEPFEAQINSAVAATADQISSRLGDDDFVVIDSRTPEEYNGWTLYNEDRGGHIRGAKQLQYEHFFNEDKTVLDYAALKAFFENKGVTADKTVTAYCTAGIRSGFVYFALRLMGYENISNYDASIWDWAEKSVGDPLTYPMAQMPRYEKLVYPGWVQKLIAGENPSTYPGNGYVILYSTWTARWEENRTDYVGTDYEKGHIPGAVFLDTYGIENGPNAEPDYQGPEEGNAKPIPELQALFAGLGIAKDTTVVVYGQEMMTSGRIAWSLLLAGVEDVRILNGGWDAWIAAGGEVETTPNTPIPVEFGDTMGNPEYLATTADVQEAVNGSVADVIIADDRSLDEYLGLSNSYYPYFYALGRIPTSRWIGDWVAIVQEDHQTMRTYTEVENNWLNAGFSPDTKMHFVCGTGWRSALYTYYAYLLDWPAANYDGGWYEWSADPENPIWESDY